MGARPWGAGDRRAADRARYGGAAGRRRSAAIEAVYLAHGGEFLVLANRSRYPARDFFDTPLHLNEACQIAHSIMLARALAPLLGRTALAPPGRFVGKPTDPLHACPGVSIATALALAPR